MASRAREQVKVRERQLFERARRLVPVWPLGEVDDSGEHPDLVINDNGRACGVEVTEVIRRGPRAVLEARRVICERARKMYVEATGYDGLQVSVIFVDDLQLPKAQHQDAAKELFELVRGKLPEKTDEPVRLHLRRGVDFESTRVTALWLHCTPMIQRSLWRATNAWWVPSLTVDMVRGEISRKEAKLPSYRQRTSTVWLLIVADGFDGSNTWSVADDVYTSAYNTQFDGVILLEDANDKASVLHRKSALSN